MTASADFLPRVMLGVLAASFLLCPEGVRAQSLTLAGGASTFLDASGFQLQYQWAPVAGWLGAGMGDSLHVGGYLGTNYQGTEFGIGDRLFPFLLDTDVLDRSYYFNGRGLTVTRRSDRESWTAFGGATTREFSTSFLRSFAATEPAGAFFYERKFRPRIKFHSWNIAGAQMTSLQSVGISIRPNWRVAATAGVGANKGYISAATEYKYKWLDLIASYTASDDRFRRIQISGPLSSERRGVNARLRISPLSNLRLELDHENVLSPTIATPNVLRATLNAANIFTSLKGFGMNCGVSESRGGRFQTRSQFLSVSRRFGSRFSGFGSVLRMRTEGNRTVGVLLGTIEEKISPRFALRQNLTHTSGSNSLSWGGRFLSNPVSIGIDYQTVFTPLAGGFNGRPLIQAWVVNLQLQLPGGARVHYDTFLNPYGKVRYTAFVSDIHYSPGEPSGGVPQTGVSLYRYVLRGVVRDERGQPVWGIAVRVDGQLVYSDSAGEFFLRVRRPGDYPLEAMSAPPLNPGSWELISAPPFIHADAKGTAPETKIVVRRAPGARKL